MSAPRLLDADTYLAVWREGHAAQGSGSANPYDPQDDPGHWRAWIKGRQAAASGAPLPEPEHRQAAAAGAPLPEPEHRTR